MKTTGLRGKFSPMNDATDAQRESILRLRDEAEADGAFLFTVRYSTWIGHGCVADHGGIAVDVNYPGGRYDGLQSVYPDGRVGR